MGSSTPNFSPCVTQQKAGVLSLSFSFAATPFLFPILTAEPSVHKMTTLFFQSSIEMYSRKHIICMCMFYMLNSKEGLNHSSLLVEELDVDNFILNVCSISGPVNEHPDVAGLLLIRKKLLPLPIVNLNSEWGEVKVNFINNEERGRIKN